MRTAVRYVTLPTTGAKIKPPCRRPTGGSSWRGPSRSALSRRNASRRRARGLIRRFAAGSTYPQREDPPGESNPVIDFLVGSNGTARTRPRPMSQRSVGQVYSTRMRGRLFIHEPVISLLAKARSSSGSRVGTWFSLAAVPILVTIHHAVQERLRCAGDRHGAHRRRVPGERAASQDRDEPADSSPRRGNGQVRRVPPARDPGHPRPVRAESARGKGGQLSGLPPSRRRSASKRASGLHDRQNADRKELRPMPCRRIRPVRPAADTRRRRGRRFTGQRTSLRSKSRLANDSSRALSIGRRWGSARSKVPRRYRTAATDVTRSVARTRTVRSAPALTVMRATPPPWRSPANRPLLCGSVTWGRGPLAARDLRRVKEWRALRCAARQDDPQRRPEEAHHGRHLSVPTCATCTT